MRDSEGLKIRRHTLRTEKRKEILYSILSKGKAEVQIIAVLQELKELIYEKYSEQSLTNSKC